MILRRATLMVSLLGLLLTAAVPALADPPPATLSLSGAVKKPLLLSIADLLAFQAVTVRLNELSRNDDYQGAFVYRGVPLQSLLELAQVGKEDANFGKAIDLAIVARNAAGQQAVLSFGEVFYRNPAEIIVATSFEPVRPFRSCTMCHKEGEYEIWSAPLERKVGLPKLVVSGDYHTDRSIEDVTSIEVVELPGDPVANKTKKLFSPAFTIHLAGAKNVATVTDLAGLPRVELTVKQVGEGRGFHGLKRYAGAPLTAVLARAKVKLPPDAALVVSAPDGYRATFSAGEIRESIFGRSILVADREDGKPIDQGGKFLLVAPDDLSADRAVKAVATLEIVPLTRKATLDVIGVGCGDTALLSLEALAAIARADVYVATDDIKQRFAPYLAGKPVLFDPLTGMLPFFKKTHPGLSTEECQKQVATLQAEHTKAIQDALKAGKTVGFLEYGDPTIYGSWTYWIFDTFSREDIRVIPGISAFNAANAMLAKNVSRKGSVVISVPDGIRANEPLLSAIAKNGDTLALFIALREMGNLKPLLDKVYKPETPVYVLYKAGYHKTGRLVKTQLRSVVEVVTRDPEQFLGVVYIGESLQ